ncbi:nucleotidyltransferase [Gordonia sp. CPCC 205515]|uniref:nucleotidyltransferase n=1 Tax=Gordonia sp. CPCC 205515 TaxID=3140791 RepID=UPI003AF37871
MTIDGAFEQYQRTVNADISQVRLARERRDTFKGAFKSQADVLDCFGSGSLARSTQLKPVHDVDLVLVYDPERHQDWGQPGGSAEAAVRHVQAEVTRLLGMSGTIDQLVRETRVAGRDRAVKCFIDPPDSDDAFTVDAMPALRSPTGTLLLPSISSQSWTEADPEYLIAEVADRQRKWSYFRPMVRVLKDWRLDQDTKIKSLVMEVLALKCLPTNRNRATALREFFAAAAVEVFYGVEDPARFCGSVQTDLDTAAVSAALSSAADNARLACAAGDDGDTDTAKFWWRQVFGTDFPGPESQPNPPYSAPAVTAPRRVRDAPQG